MTCFNGASRFWRGQLVIKREVSYLDGASTGPPAFGGGNLRWRHTWGIAMFCFNGASRFWRGQSGITGSVEEGFSMLQRGLPLLAGAMRSTRPTMISGRRFNGASRFWRGQSINMDCILYRNNSFNGASRFWRGQSAMPAGVNSMMLLQRGLPLLAGAIMPRIVRPNPGIRFNGASRFWRGQSSRSLAPR